jgi:hypothetical protein
MPIINPSYSGGRDQEDQSSKPVRENSSGDPISKNTQNIHNQNKRAGGVAQVEHLPSKYEALRSNLSTDKKKENTSLSIQN